MFWGRAKPLLTKLVCLSRTMYVLRWTTCRYLANQPRCQERMPRITLKHSPEQVAFLKILEAKICRCDVRRFKCTFSLTDADSHARAQTHARNVYVRVHRDMVGWERAHFTSRIFLALLLPLSAKTLDSARSVKSPAAGLKLISIYASFPKYARIFLLSR
jgi:hypothetical protein